MRGAEKQLQPTGKQYAEKISSKKKIFQKKFVFLRFLYEPPHHIFFNN